MMCLRLWWITVGTRGLCAIALPGFPIVVATRTPVKPDCSLSGRNAATSRKTLTPANPRAPAPSACLRTGSQPHARHAAHDRGPLATGPDLRRSLLADLSAARTDVDETGSLQKRSQERCSSMRGIFSRFLCGGPFGGGQAGAQALRCRRPRNGRLWQRVSSNPRVAEKLFATHCCCQ